MNGHCALLVKVTKMKINNKLILLSKDNPQDALDSQLTKLTSNNASPIRLVNKVSSLPFALIQL
jgi:hypothetical protein